MITSLRVSPGEPQTYRYMPRDALHKPQITFDSEQTPRGSPLESSDEAMFLTNLRLADGDLPLTDEERAWADKLLKPRRTKKSSRTGRAA